MSKAAFVNTGIVVLCVNLFITDVNLFGPGIIFKIKNLKNIINKYISYRWFNLYCFLHIYDECINTFNTKDYGLKILCKIIKNINLKETRRKMLSYTIRG